MAIWKAVAGSALLIESGPDWHLYFVLNDPMNFAGYPNNSCLIVNISTPHARSDKTCVLSAEKHKFLKHDSFIFYEKARVRPAAELEKLVASRTYQPHAPVPLDLIRFIVSFMPDGLHVSDEIQHLAKLVEDQFKPKARPAATPAAKVAGSADTAASRKPRPLK